MSSVYIFKATWYYSIPFIPILYSGNTVTGVY